MLLVLLLTPVRVVLAEVVQVVLKQEMAKLVVVEEQMGIQLVEHGCLEERVLMAQLVQTTGAMARLVVAMVQVVVVPARTLQVVIIKEALGKMEW